MTIRRMEQQRQHLHRGVVDGIARLSDPYYRDERHKLKISGYIYRSPINRRSLQHIVDFLDNADVYKEAITELELHDLQLPTGPPDGGLEVLHSFFSRSDKTLIKVTLDNCNFGSQESASQLVSAFHSNLTVTDLTIRRIRNLEGTALGNSLSGLLQNMSKLQRLDCGLGVEEVLAFQTSLKTNRTLRELNLWACNLRDEGIRLIADALVGNTNIEVLNIGWNDITSNGLDQIRRILESTHLQTINIGYNRVLFNDRNATQRFSLCLSRHAFLKKLALCGCRLGDGGLRLLLDGLIANTILEVLHVGWNQITSVSLADITRLLVSTRLKSILICGNHRVFDDAVAVQHFVKTLQDENSSVQELPMLVSQNFPINIRTAAFANINNCLTRNRQLNCVNLLLAPPPSPPQQQLRNAGAIMLKLSHKAITKFAMVPNNAGASAIFKLFQARPQLLENRLKRPVAATTAVVVSQKQKRRCL